MYGYAYHSSCSIMHPISRARGLIAKFQLVESSLLNSVLILWIYTARLTIANLPDSQLCRWRCGSEIRHMAAG
jgi:hypothetical protein